jgi:hypothetical protein
MRTKADIVGSRLFGPVPPAERRLSAASQSTAPPVALGKGEAGAVPGHGLARPDGTRTAFAGFVPCFFRHPAF